MYYSNACLFCHFVGFWARKSAEEKFWVKGFRTIFNLSKSRPIWGQNLRPVSFSLNCVVCEGVATAGLYLSSPELFSRSCSSPSFLTMADVGFSVPHTLLLTPEAKGIQELRNTHANSKYVRELKTNNSLKTPRVEVKHENWIRLQNKHCFFIILLHSLWSFCNKIVIQDFFPNCNLPLHHP